MNQVRITVLMPVYNGEQHLAEAIDSILNQTYTDFEFLIVNDGSTDNSVEIIRSYSDERIRLINNETNIGVAASLNKGLDLATGDYVARMDCDDISLPRRLEKQVAFMEWNTDVGICGTWIMVTGKGISSVMRYPVDSATIKSTFLFYSALAHPAAMFRKSAFNKHGLRYDSAYKGTEDYELWVRAIEVFQIANIPEILVNYRLHPGQASVKVGMHQKSEAASIRRTQITRLGIDPSSRLAQYHEAVALREMRHCKDEYCNAENWLIEINEKNKRAGIYPEDVLARVISERWFRICSDAAGSGFWALKAYLKSPLRKNNNLPLQSKMFFLTKCAMGCGRTFIAKLGHL